MPFTPYVDIYKSLHCLTLYQMSAPAVLLSAEDSTRSADEVIKHFHLGSEHCVGAIHQHLVGQRGLLVVVDSHQRKDPVGFVCLVHHQQTTGTLPHHLQ